MDAGEAVAEIPHSVYGTDFCDLQHDWARAAYLELALFGVVSKWRRFEAYLDSSASPQHQLASFQ